jgi:hypothetical protein
MCVVREKNKSKDHNKHPIEKKYRDFNRCMQQEYKKKRNPRYYNHISYVKMSF